MWLPWNLKAGRQKIPSTDVCNPDEVGVVGVDKWKSLFDQHRHLSRVLVMCLFIHPVQYKHFRATYTIHSSINDKYWGLEKRQQLEEVVYKCKKYAGPFIFVWNAHNFAFLFLFFSWSIRATSHKQGPRIWDHFCLNWCWRRKNHQSQDFTSFNITIMIKLTLGLCLRKSPNQNVLENSVQCTSLPGIFVH